MKTKLFEVRQYYEAPECECGGVFTISAGAYLYLSAPLQKDYKCNKCGKVARLREPEFPGLRHEIIGLSS